MDISRRWFLGGAIGVAAVAVLPKTAAYAHTLYGDGVHDDTEALQALLDGKPVHIKDDGVTVRQKDGRVELIGGDYLISAPINLRSNNSIIDCRISSKEDIPHLLKIHNVENVFVTGSRFKGAAGAKTIFADFKG